MSGTSASEDIIKVAVVEDEVCEGRSCCLVENENKEGEKALGGPNTAKAISREHKYCSHAVLVRNEVRMSQSGISKARLRLLKIFELKRDGDRRMKGDRY